MLLSIPTVAASYQWEQLAEAPYVLGDPDIRQQNNRQLIAISEYKFTEWHVPSPGVFALRLAHGVKPAQVLEAFESDGSGLLVPVLFSEQPEDNLWRLQNGGYESRIVHLRAKQQELDAEAFYLSVHSAIAAEQQPLWPEGFEHVRLREHRLSLGERYIVVPANRAVTVALEGQTQLRLHMRTLFTEQRRSNLDYALSLKLDGNHYQRYQLRALQDKSQAWLINQRRQLVSHAKDEYLQLSPDVREVSIESTHALLLRVEAISQAAVMLPGANAKPADRLHNQEFDRLIAQQARWRALVEQSETNLVADAPLRVAANLREQSGSDINDQRLRAQVLNRYTDLLDLLPRASHSSPLQGRYAEYRKPRLIHPQESNRQRWLSRAAQSTAANNAPGAWFMELPAGGRLQYDLPEHKEPADLRLTAVHSDAATPVPIVLSFADGQKQTLLLDPRHSHTDRHDPAQALTHSRDVEWLGDGLATAKIDSSQAWRSVDVYNAGTETVRLALQQRTAKRHQHRERDWMALLNEDGSTLPQLWSQAWNSGLDEQQRWHGARAMAALEKRGQTIVNGWLPALQYLTDRASDYSPRRYLQITNAHCRDGKPTERNLSAAAWRAEHQGQWLKASEHWRDLVSASNDSQCVDAHLRLVNSLARSGYPGWADDYRRQLLRSSDHMDLIEKLIHSAQQHYQAQQRPNTMVALFAYVAHRWPQQRWHQALSHALLDAGHDRYGITVGLIQPLLHADARLHATLLKLGWNTLLETRLQAQDRSSQQPLALAKLRQVRIAPISSFQYAGSHLLRDRLYDSIESTAFATASQPIRFTVTGPMQLRLSLRPLTKNGESAGDWTLVSVGGQEYPVPMSARNLLPRYQVLTGSHEVGTSAQWQVTLPKGKHQLQIAPQSGTVAAKMHAINPWQDSLKETMLTTDPRVRTLGAAPPTPLPRQVQQTAKPEQSFNALLSLPRTPEHWQQILAWQPTNAGQRAQLMKVLVYVANADSRRSAAAASRAEWLARQAPGDSNLTGLLHRVRRGSAWAALELHNSTASMHLEKLQAFAPINELWRVKNLFVKPWRPSETLLSQGNSLDLSVTAPRDLQLRFTLTHEGFDLDSDSMALTLSHNKQPDRIVDLPPGQQDDVTLSLPQGDHELSLSLPQLESGNAFARVSIEQRIAGQWQPFAQPRRRRYYQAQPGNPLRFSAKGPAWLRIDELHEDGRSSHYRYLPPDEYLLEDFAKLSPDGLFKPYIRRWQSTGAETEQKLRWAAPVMDWPTAQSQSLAALPPASNTPEGSIPLFRASRPTDSFSLGWFSENEGLEDSTDDALEYTEFGASRRNRTTGTNRFNEYSALGRSHQAGGNLLGASLRHWRPVEDSPFWLRGEVAGYVQSLQGNTAWSVHTKLRASQFFSNGAQRVHNTTLELLARHTSEEQRTSGLDPKVFSSYLRDHPTGINLAHRLSWRPYLDTELYGEVSVRSNDLLQTPSLDFLRSRYGARLQVGPLQLGSELAFTQYLEDSDRNRSLLVPKLGVSVRWYDTSSAQRRFEVRSRLRYDFKRRETSAAIQVLLHLDRGQGLRDFHGERHWLDPLLNERFSARTQSE